MLVSATANPSHPRPAPSPAQAGGLEGPPAAAGPARRWRWPHEERRSLRRRFVSWIESRLPRSDSWTLTQRNIYILPTKAGWAFGGMLLIMLIGSINYQLNLGYLLTFLLTGCGLVSMQMTHATLKGLTLRLRPVAPVYAGEPAQLEVVLTSPNTRRHGIGLSLFDTRRFGWKQGFIDVPAHGSASARLAMVPERRGRHRVPTITIETRFPLGLFRAWSLWRPAAEALAWPRPENPPPALPGSQPAAGEGRFQRRSEGGEFDGVRAWRRGDSMRHVVWKKVARTGELISRDASAAVNRELWLDWGAARQPGAGLEERLSRLTAWILEAEKNGQPWGLRLPQRDTAPALGDAHRMAALETLALWR
ncbi:MAG: DUF58 domain-containing protein [Rubrivivax sp.]|nr:DUF58 domain-containing protein [Rubrivivax sp.]